MAFTFIVLCRLGAKLKHFLFANHVNPTGWGNSMSYCCHEEQRVLLACAVGMGSGPKRQVAQDGAVSLPLCRKIQLSPCVLL